METEITSGFLMKIDKKQITRFQAKILAWYDTHQRDLPWRKTRDPYTILVSEVMSQQTQIERVIPKYEAFMQAFPTVEDLARAKAAEVLRLWSGLGYNRRALNLQRAAQQIIDEYDGTFPTSPEELEKLPGVGKYTSRAVACFAFNQQIAVVDTNIRKVIAVAFNKGILPNEREIEATAQQILPEGKAYIWNQALMDYAAQVLKEHKIPIPKQSHFFTSNRYYRGQILKQLLQKQEMEIDDLSYFFQEKGRGIEKEKLERIVRDLEKEGFLQQKKARLMLSHL